MSKPSEMMALELAVLRDKFEMKAFVQRTNETSLATSLASMHEAFSTNNIVSNPVNITQKNQFECERNKNKKEKKDENESENNNEIVKIWFAKPGNPALGKLNEYRLFCHKSRFPNDKLYLISNYEDFKDKSEYDYIVKFCKDNDIILIGLNKIEAQITASMINEKEKIGDEKIQLELLKIARQEIETSTEQQGDKSTGFGSAAAASDIVRALSPQLGCYMDLDIVKLNPFTIKQEIWGNVFGLALDTRIEFDAERGSFQNLGLNNSLLVCNESENNFLKIYRNLVYANYYNKDNKFDDIVRELNEQKIFDLESYKKAAKYMKDKKTQLEYLPKALRFKCAYKACASEADYHKFLKAFVIHVSGPKCMQLALEKFMEVKIIPTCSALIKAGRGNMIPGALESLKLTFFTGEVGDDNDQSWLPSFDNTRNRLETMEKAATKFQAVVRGHQTRKKLAAK